MKINERISEIFEKFNGFPNHSPILRSGQRDDAFVLLTFEILFQNYHGIKRFEAENENHREILTQYIVPPPDDYIDIFYEEPDIDEKRYHIVQVKHSRLAQAEIETCFTMMEKSVNMYLNSPKDLKKNLKNIIADTDFNSQFKKSCTYYVVHKGDTNFIRNQKCNYQIITLNELSLLQDGVKHECVPKEAFNIDTANNFIINNFIDDKQNSIYNKGLPQSMLCNFNGYDLAVLNNKYANTLVGRNILYGQNLRESLNKNSKTYESMFETVNIEPQLFLFYNNGITILANSFDARTENGKEKITLEKFSIINGAQTTSTLGAYLREAEVNSEHERIENLKKVFVLTKIFKINEELTNYSQISENIKIYNNTQTPLSSRDMVSIRYEQKKLQEKYFEQNSPNIFIYIKKGESIPSYPKTYPHQRITNEVLAQIVLCGFFSEPFNAKDKKSRIFDYSNQDRFTLNPVYHKIFDKNDGILFSKTKHELDELLFIFRLHEDTKKFQKFLLKKQLSHLNQTPAENDIDRQSREDRINRVKRNMEISSVCLFYNITAYFEIRKNYDHTIHNIDSVAFDYKRYYDDKTFKDSMIKDFLSLAFNETVELIRKNSGVENVNNYLRFDKNERIFLDNYREQLINRIYDYSEKYKDFVKKYKITCA